MHSTLTAKREDDPHDVVVVAPDAVRVAPSDEEELSSLLQQAARRHSDVRAAPDIAVDRVPPVDTTFRPGSIDDVRVPGGRRSTAGRALRGFMALLLAACIGVAAVGWKAYGDVAKRQIAKWTTQFVLISSLTSEQPASATQPAPLAVPADAASPQPSPPAQAAAEAAARAADPAPSLQSMSRDLAGVTQQVEQLKASIDELKASQQQMSHDLAKASEAKASEAKASEAKASEAKASEVKASEVRASEASPRPRIPPAPPRAVVARARKPVTSYPPPQALLPPVPPQAAAPYVPRQAEPQPQFAAEPPQADPELSSVPRPPMPLR
jgi:hypothetical protein